MSENTTVIKDKAPSLKEELSLDDKSVIQTTQADGKDETKKENPWLTPYKKELYKIVFEKFLIALILVIVGFFATRLVEEFKSKQSFHAELNKVRIQKIGELWEKVYLFASIDEKVFGNADSFDVHRYSDIKTLEEFKEMEERRKEALKVDRRKLLQELE